MIGNFKRESKEAVVSPIIGVILLVVITVVIAAAVWVWLTGIIGGGTKATPGIEMSVTKEDRNYTVNITSVSRAVGLDKVKVLILKEAVAKDIFILNDPKIYGNKTGMVSFLDEDMDMTLSVGDCLKLRGEYAESGITVMLIHIPTNEIMGEVTLP
ncbi:MAG: type IV pilin [Candidatus Thermoplasmatota archaeon]|nr:type IV pilin [Candidatus Thermoplasmatota archaeon]